MRKWLGWMLLSALFLISCAGQHSAQQAEKSEGEPVEKKAENPFFEEWTTPFGVPPFDEIKNAHFLPAIKRGIELHKKEIGAIADNPGEPTFVNTIEAMDKAGSDLDRVLRVFYGLLSARTDDELNGIAQKVSPLLSQHRDSILLNGKLFSRIEAVYSTRHDLNLTVEQGTLFEEFYQDFVRGGANLSEENKTRLKALNEELSLLTLKFGQNVLKETNRFEMVLDDKKDLDGLPERVINAAAHAAKKKGQDGKWLFTIHKPSLFPFLQYSTRRDLREKMFKAYINQGRNGGDLDNREYIKKIIRLRTEKARMLGYDNYAQYALSRRVAGTPEAVYDLLNKLWEPALKVANSEIEQLQEMIDKEGRDFKLQSWDWWFYAEKLRKAKYDLDENELRPYFKLENVQQGAFAVAEKLYGIKFIERNDIPKYHPDVKVFEVQEADGSHLGIFYTDFFPRASKRGGAWCGTYRDPGYENGKKIHPVVNNVGNFTMPTGDKPALLSFEEVETLFHEFGHALHVLFNDTKYSRTGDAVRVDFVELPSQIMENWAREPEVLKMYARHYKTDEPIPDALIEKIRNVGTFNQGFATVEYLAASFLDMDWHTAQHGDKIDVDGFEKASLDAIQMPDEIIVRYRSPYFRHIFSGGYYAAGYYSYIWAAVLDADAFEAFKENGLFDLKTAAAFRGHVLSRGGSEDQMDMYRRFRGAEPSIEPLLKRRGLVEN